MKYTLKELARLDITRCYSDTVSLTVSAANVEPRVQSWGRALPLQPSHEVENATPFTSRCFEFLPGGPWNKYEIIPEERIADIKCISKGRHADGTKITTDEWMRTNEQVM